ncbi:MAG: cadherin domain-containing protein, partial [Fuerstiella sp.]
ITDTNTDANAVDEDASVGAVVGITAFASDADGTNNGVTYSLSDDAGGLFAIDPNTGEVTVAGSIDFETATNHSIEVTATSDDGSTSTQTFAINVNDVNEGPTDITITGGTVNETVESGGTIGSAFDPSGSTVATLSTTDVDAGETFTYSITNDPSGHFEIVGNEVRVKSGQTIDYETATSHDLTIEVTDSNGSTYSETITINVEDYEGSYTGASNADTHTGTSEEDTVSTGGGSDTIIGSDGADSIDGGTGKDTVDYSGSTEGVTVNFETGKGTGGQAEGDTYTNVENVIGSDHDDYVKGTYSEGTTANLGAGDDKFDNTQGYFDQHDTVYAEAGNDTVYTGDGNDTIDGGTGNDQLFGEGGDDTILGGDGDDSIRGGAGDDTITGGAGDDTIIGDEYLGTDNDTVVYTGNWADYTITQSGSYFTITDNRPGSPDGTDTVHTTIENFQFADATVPQADILNDAPTDITVSGGSIDENSSTGTVVATLGTTDADSFIPSETATYSITNDPSGNFEIVGNEVRVKAGSNIDFESDTTHDITVQVTDVHGATYSETITINVNDVDEFDVSAITDTDASANTVAENVSVGTSVGITAFASDADGSNNGITYSLSDDAGGLFAIDPNTGEVTVAGSIDYETATNHSIEVTATSDDGSTSTQTFAINVDNINESGVSAITDTDGSANTVDEDASVGAVVGITALATDADATDTVTYSLSDDAGGLFTIDANTGVVTVASGLDAETATSHNIEVTATSTDGSTTTETFSIGVNDVNETSISAITDTDGSANSVSESATVGTAVGITALATDADVTDTVTYSLSSNPGSFFSIDANTGEVTVASGLDFETNEDHTIEVTATSTDGTTSTQSFTIDVTDDTSEASVSSITDTDGTTNAVDENSAVGTSVGITAFASDADGSDDVTYSLSDDAGGLFAIDPNTGEVTVAGNIDFETQDGHKIEVTATSDDGSTSTKEFKINVNDQDEFDVSAITDTDASANTVAENVSVGTSVGITAFASDADGSNNGVTYSLSDDAGGLFAIDAETGEVTVAGKLDFETADSYGIEVTATSEDGSTSVETFKINITDQDEFDVSAITDTNTDANAVDEDASVGAVVGITAFASDADGTNNGVTYSLSDDAGG